jgi:tetratricopeptide (TPR) repeat protein
MMSDSRHEDGKEEQQALTSEAASGVVEDAAVPAVQSPPADDEDENSGDVDALSTDRPKATNSAAAVQQSSSSSSFHDQSMTKALFFSWILPVLVLAAISRFTVNLEPDPDLTAASSSRNSKPRPVALKFDDPTVGSRGTKKVQKKPQQRDAASPTQRPTAAPSKLPTNYVALVDTIDKRRRRVGRFAAPSYSSSSAGAASSSSSSDSRAAPLSSSKPDKDRRAAKDGGQLRRGQGALSDPDRVRFRKRLADLQGQYDADPTDLFLALELADAYRMYEVQYHDGGSHEADALHMYEVVTGRVEQLRTEATQQGQATSIPDDGRDITDEMMLPYPQRSLDGLLCAVYSGQGKALYMANMFAKSVDSYTRCLQVIPEYLDALDARASSYIVLGMYEEAASDYRVVIDRDQNQLLFAQAYTGMARVLEARENATDGGWSFVVEILEAVIPRLEARHDAYPQMQKVLAPALNRLHHVVR